MDFWRIHAENLDVFEEAYDLKKLIFETCCGAVMFV